jgi:adenylate cyclase
MITGSEAMATLRSVARRLVRIVRARRGPAVRRLRLGSGLVLFGYLASHLANHSLGLVSIAVAERGLRIAMAVWHSAPGTSLLYGAAATHFALALGTLCSRRLTRMPPSDLLRIAFGFGIPWLLIGHFATTRAAFELYGVPPDYHRIVWMLFSSGGEGRQLALLAPGWVHGCLGLNFAFGRHPLWRRLRPLLFGAALLLPVLAALGFLAMGRELAALGADPAWRAAHVALLDARQHAGVEHLREWLLAAYAGAIGAALLARTLRAALEKGRGRHPFSSSGRRLFIGLRLQPDPSTRGGRAGIGKGRRSA